MVVGSSSRNGTASGRVGRVCDVVAVKAEVGYVIASFCNSETIVGSGRNDGSVLSPVDESVACVGRGDQVAGCAVVVGSASRNGTASGRVGRGCDVVAVKAEIGYVVTSFCNGETVIGTG